jgi:hypothetical protein
MENEMVDLSQSVFLSGIEEPLTPKIEIHVCPVCLKNCEGKTELLEHYWGYCLKTRNYFDSFLFPEKS